MFRVRPFTLRLEIKNRRVFHDQHAKVPQDVQLFEKSKTIFLIHGTTVFFPHLGSFVNQNLEMWQIFLGLVHIVEKIFRLKVAKIKDFKSKKAKKPKNFRRSAPKIKQ